MDTLRNPHGGSIFFFLVVDMPLKKNKIKDPRYSVHSHAGPRHIPLSFQYILSLKIGTNNFSTHSANLLMVLSLFCPNPTLLEAIDLKFVNSHSFTQSLSWTRSNFNALSLLMIKILLSRVSDEFWRAFSLVMGPFVILLFFIADLETMRSFPVLMYFIDCQVVKWLTDNDTIVLSFFHSAKLKRTRLLDVGVLSDPFNKTERCNKANMGINNCVKLYLGMNHRISTPCQLAHQCSSHVTTLVPRSICRVTPPPEKKMAESGGEGDTYISQVAIQEILCQGGLGMFPGGLKYQVRVAQNLGTLPRSTWLNSSLWPTNPQLHSKTHNINHFFLFLLSLKVNMQHCF
ncbi:hypothetical protein VP01_1727g1 [Puccinia sorghi]|uniref:Uncharacterized protein n=1 Tax=Puccinia sorghi TaxID=27349 RepID=A0A0L6VFZ0_9BASI|nr:hypothetical protein VP01_1727g1 [Puccinia sorghi]